MRFVLAVLLTLPLLTRTVGAQSFSDDFNRPDGAVGNGWNSWNANLANGQLQTFGVCGDAGGAYRTLPVTFPLSFSFDFRTASVAGRYSFNDGGWGIGFNMQSAGWIRPAQLIVIHYSGQRNISRAYWNGSTMVQEDVLEGPVGSLRDYQASVFAHIDGKVNADLSMVITIRYNDGRSPDPVTVSLGPPPGAANVPMGSSLMVANANCSYGPHYFDNFTIQQAVADTAGPQTTDLTISVNPLPVNSAGSVLTASIDDSKTGGSNIASAEYNIDGAQRTPMDLSASAAVTVQASASLPPFTQSNVYDVCVRGSDVAGNVGQDACILLPVYDPTGGFVTGGGQVASPAGADLLNTAAAGQTIFGFVSKYLPGRNTPSGNLEFQFKEGDLNFKSTSMDWLVVTGEPRAMFWGTGTINGGNICKFEVNAWDGSFQPENVDAFGLKIFSCASGGDRYNLAATPLTKGSIVIHAK